MLQMELKVCGETILCVADLERNEMIFQLPACFAGEAGKDFPACFDNSQYKEYSLRNNYIGCLILPALMENVSDLDNFDLMFDKQSFSYHVWFATQQFNTGDRNIPELEGKPVMVIQLYPDEMDTDEMTTDELIDKTFAHDFTSFCGLYTVTIADFINPNTSKFDFSHWDDEYNVLADCADMINEDLEIMMQNN